MEERCAEFVSQRGGSRSGSLVGFGFGVGKFMSDGLQRAWLSCPKHPSSLRTQNPLFSRLPKGLIRGFKLVKNLQRSRLGFLGSGSNYFDLRYSSALMPPTKLLGHKTNKV